MSKLTTRLKDYVKDTKLLCNELSDGICGEPTESESDMIHSLYRCMERLDDDVAEAEYIPPPVDMTKITHDEADLIDNGLELLQDQLQYDTFAGYTNMKCTPEFLYFDMEVNFGDMFKYTIPISIGRTVMLNMANERESDEFFGFIIDMLRKHIKRGGKYEV